MEDVPIRNLFRREIVIRSLLRDPQVDFPPSRTPAPGLSRDPVSDTEQPACDRLLPANGTGPLGQNQENRLVGILGAMRVVENSPAHAEDHRTMADHQFLEGRFRGIALLGGDQIQKLGIRH